MEGGTITTLMLLFVVWTVLFLWIFMFQVFLLFLFSLPFSQIEGALILLLVLFFGVHFCSFPHNQKKIKTKHNTRLPTNCRGFVVWFVATSKEDWP